MKKTKGEYVGTHLICELWNCDRKALDDPGLIDRAIKAAIEESGATLIGIQSHQFAPQGVTAVALLKESHLSIHTWPETGYAAVDIFTCGDHTMPQKAALVMKKSLGAKSIKTIKLSRGLPEQADDQAFL
jgi:S-adenosylmethionine decarboxylase